MPARRFQRGEPVSGHLRYRLTTSALVLIAAFLSPACVRSTSAADTPVRPNILLIVSDDQGYYGHKYSPDEYDVTFERVGGMDLREIIIPRMLKSAGYKSGIYGKWDLGTLKRFLPTSRGFNDFYGLVNTGIDYYTHERYGVPSMYRNLVKTEEDKGIYCTYLFEREAMRFLEQHATNDPFFLYVPFNAPHGSSALEPEIRSTVQAPNEFKKMYPAVAKEYREVPNFRYAENAKVVTPEARVRDYRAAVTCMDASIGKMLAVLEEKKVLDNTIVIFLSDNGGSGGADNAPLRGHKSQIWEGGIRVPCLIRWPEGNIPAGSVNDELLTSLELFPSFASATGAALPQDVPLDGYDWWSTVKGETKSPRTEMFWKRKNLIGARVGKWKWVDMGGKSGGLFDLAADIGETNDLSAKRPQILKMVKDRYANWLAEMEAAEPRGPFRDF
ncbi:MAG TPA: sulfatase-like hydrolase/transferase [Pirellulaceae bacterium]|nr:sulfatase-like hydrolase/transferase [Pirellulaceae bacterium]